MSALHGTFFRTIFVGSRLTTCRVFISHRRHGQDKAVLSCLLFRATKEGIETRVENNMKISITGPGAAEPGD